MHLRTITLKGGLLLGAGQVASQACSFLRNIIVARLISPANFGIAAIFAMTLSVLDMISNMASEKLLIQTDDGEERNLQATAHLLLFGRGLFSAAVLFSCAGVVSRLFGAPDARWAFSYLALVPLVRGLTHLDMCLVQRDLTYGPAVKTDVTTNLFALLLSWPLAYWLRDYSAMLWIIIGQATMSVLASHWVARHPYKWSWNRTYLRRITLFGWPLLINGVLIFGIFQGDRFIIGSANRIFHREIYSLSDLGVYSIAFALTLAPTLTVASIASALFLPLFSRVKNLPPEFNRRCSLCAQALALISGTIALPFILCGPDIVTLIYGASYSTAGSFVGWLAAMQGVSILRRAPTIAAMSRGDTKNAMYSNIFRSLAFVSAFAVAWVGGPLVWMAVSGFVGEVLALIVSMRRLFRLHGISPLVWLRPVGLAVLLTLAVVSLMKIFVHAHFLTEMLLTGLLVVLYVALMIAIFTPLRIVIRDAFGDLLRWRIAAWPSVVK